MMTTYRIDITLLPASPFTTSTQSRVGNCRPRTAIGALQTQTAATPHASSGPAALDLSPPFLAPWSGTLILVNPETVVCGIAPALNHWPIGRRSAALSQVDTTQTWLSLPVESTEATVSAPTAVREGRGSIYRRSEVQQMPRIAWYAPVTRSSNAAFTDCSVGGCCVLPILLSPREQREEPSAKTFLLWSRRPWRTMSRAVR
jgi:hypothetical protein